MTCFCTLNVLSNFSTDRDLCYLFLTTFNILTLFAYNNYMLLDNVFVDGGDVSESGGNQSTLVLEVVLSICITFPYTLVYLQYGLLAF